MLPVVLALLSAFAYGISDYLSGAASRRVHYARIAWIVQAVMGLATWCVVWVFAGQGSVSAAGWGMLAGLGSSAGTMWLYRGLGRGQMNVVAPLSAATAALVPVVAGLVFGERPSWLILLGVAAVIPAIWLISSGSSTEESGASELVDVAGPASRRLAAGALDGLLAGVGFALSFIALDRAPVNAGLWPAAYAQLAAFVVITVAVMVVLRRTPVPREKIDRASARNAAAAGLLGASAVACFVVATQQGLLVVVSVLASLYPAVTVVLAAVLLRERTRRAQLVGLGLAAAGVALVALG